VVDIQSATAEIKRGKRTKKKKKKETGQRYNVRICYAGRHYKYKVKTKLNNRKLEFTAGLK